MAKNVLRAELKLDTAKANRNAKQAGKEAKKFGQNVTDSTGKGKQGMDGLSKATAGFGRSVVALGASYLTLAGLQQAIGKIIEAYNRALVLRRELMTGAEQFMRTVAPLASQFGISETAAARLVGQIGQRAGAAPSSGAAITGLTTSAASAGLIGDITETKGLEPVIAKRDRDILVELAKFAEFTGEPEIGAALAKLVKKGLGKQEVTEENVRRVLGQTIAAYRKSELSKWGDFFKGAVGGLSGLLAQGVSYETGLSRFASLAQMKKSGQAAGEVFRLIGERFFTADDPQMIAFIDQKHGEGTYWRLKRDDPDKLFGLIIDTLTEGEGPERAERMKQLGITAEISGRIALLKGAGGQAADIAGKMRGATAAGTGAELDKWRAGQRGVAQAGAMKAKMDALKMGVGPGKGMQSALLTVADQELKRWEQEDPATFWAAWATSPERQMKNLAIERALVRQMQGQGADLRTIGGLSTEFDIDITGDEAQIRWGAPSMQRGFGIGFGARRDVLRPLIGAAAADISGTNININTVNMPAPQNRMDLPSKSESAAGGAK